MLRFLTAAIALIAAPLAAQDFSEGSNAKEWGLFGEAKAFFAATVVDPLCVLTGDCPDNCGDGRRQLALLRTVDDVMVFPNKNSQPAFTGAANEMLPFCGQAVEVDGLLITDEELGAQNIYLLQTIRAEGDSEWVKANSWTKQWAEANPEAAGKGPWFRRDLRIKEIIAREGWLGLGLETDEAFLEEWFQ